MRRRISLLDVVGIELRLSELLGQPVELVEEGTLKPRVQKSVEAEASVPSSDPLQRFQDILENIGRIEDLFRQTRCSSSARLRRNLLTWLKNSAPRFPGPRYGASETSCATNTTESTSFASGC